MPTCSACGQDNPDGFRFCGRCGTALAAEAPREVRKVVTVLFCDIVGSTALGERSDPEALRARLGRVFEELRAVLERHGATVEKFAGDAVMAVFGIPVSHEDDALRAVRAAAEMRVAVPGHGFAARIGVNTGEVVAGEGETLVTGDAVNVAARLEQAADPGEILIGADTLRLTRDAVTAEPAGPLALKGKSHVVGAHRLIAVDPDAPAFARHLDAPLIGRERERERLHRDFDDAVSARTCRLFTLLGPAGVGKSRLVAEFLSGAATQADVLHGRCLHYGEGITYWPLVELLTRAEVDTDDVVRGSPEETQLAFRRLLEARAATRPQIVVFDDLHWAEPTFLDLVEHVADWSREAPLLLLCVARPELLELRPGWSGGKLNATSVLLEPLGADECGSLIDALLGGGELPKVVRARILDAAEGNPLFVEEMVAMVQEDGASDVVVPPTIHALLQARLDRLRADERAVIERGAVEGKVFHRSAVQELTPDRLRPEVGSHLLTLVRKELIRPDRATFPDDDAFRFRHLLIRDAAYEALSKETRAELHGRFADWLERHELVERDEIVGYHLEQAHRYRAELDADDPRLDAIADRTTQRLGAAGRAALDRADWTAGRNLLGRAVALLPEGDARRLSLSPDLVRALMEAGDFEAARGFLGEAHAAPDARTRAYASVLEWELDFRTGTASDLASGHEAITAARSEFEAAGDELGIALCERGESNLSWIACRAADSAAAAERAAAHAEAAGVAHLAEEMLIRATNTLPHGPTPVEEAFRRCHHALEQAAGRVLLSSAIEEALGRLQAMRGEIEAGRELVARAVDIAREAGLPLVAAGSSQAAAFVELRAGNLGEAERLLREGAEELERAGERGVYSTNVLYLAETVYDQGREDEAEMLCRRCREVTNPDDMTNIARLAGLEASLVTHRGELGEAERLARHGVEVADETDFYELRAVTRIRLAEVLAAAGRRTESRAAADDGIAIYEAKGDIAGAEIARARLERLT